MNKKLNRKKRLMRWLAVLLCAFMLFGLQPYILAADSQQLAQAIVQAESLLDNNINNQGYEVNNYLPEDYQTLSNAMNAASSLDASATQEEIDDAYNTLQEAITNFVPVIMDLDVSLLNEEIEAAENFYVDEMYFLSTEDYFFQCINDAKQARKDNLVLSSGTADGIEQARKDLNFESLFIKKLTITPYTLPNTQLSCAQGSDILDGNPNTYYEFITSHTPLPKSYTIDLGGSYDLDGIKYVSCPFNGRKTKEYKIEVSSDNIHFTTVHTGTFGISEEIAGKGYRDIADIKFNSRDLAKNAKYLRFTMLSGHYDGYGIADLYINTAPSPESLELTTISSETFDSDSTGRLLSETAEDSANGWSTGWKADRALQTALSDTDGGAGQPLAYKAMNGRFTNRNVYGAYRGLKDPIEYNASSGFYAMFDINYLPDQTSGAFAAFSLLSSNNVNIDVLIGGDNPPASMALQINGGMLPDKKHLELGQDYTILIKVEGQNVFVKAFNTANELVITDNNSWDITGTITPNYTFDTIGISGMTYTDILPVSYDNIYLAGSPADNIDINADNLLLCGDSRQLIANFTENGSYAGPITWSSSNEAVATVDQSGLVTAIEQGRTFITASSEDGLLKDTFCLSVVGKVVAYETFDAPDNTGISSLNNNRYFKGPWTAYGGHVLDERYIVKNGMAYVNQQRQGMTNYGMKRTLKHDMSANNDDTVYYVTFDIQNYENYGGTYSSVSLGDDITLTFFSGTPAYNEKNLVKLKVGQTEITDNGSLAFDYLKKYHVLMRISNTGNYPEVSVKLFDNFEEPTMVPENWDLTLTAETQQKYEYIGFYGYMFQKDIRYATFDTFRMIRMPWFYTHDIQVNGSFQSGESVSLSGKIKREYNTQNNNGISILTGLYKGEELIDFEIQNIENQELSDFQTKLFTLPEFEENADYSLRCFLWGSTSSLNILYEPIILDESGIR